MRKTINCFDPFTGWQKRLKPFLHSRKMFLYLFFIQLFIFSTTAFGQKNLLDQPAAELKNTEPAGIHIEPSANVIWQTVDQVEIGSQKSSNAFTATAPLKINLDQVRNGSAASPVSPGEWVNGNLNGSQAHYAEKWAIPYRLTFTGLPLGAHTVVIEWDIRQGGRNALDYITQYDLIDNPPGSHVNTFGHTQETIDATIGFTGLGTANKYQIPTPNATSSPSTIAKSSFLALTTNDIATTKTAITLYNATIANVSTDLKYLTEGSLTASSSTTQLSIKFTNTNSTVVIAWGGHIAAEADWGVGNSASAISGSPYHTRLISVDGTGGNQDRSLSADAVIDPPACTLDGPSPVQCSTQNSYTNSLAVPSGYTFTWSLVNNTSGATFNGSTSSSTSVSVNSGSAVKSGGGCGTNYTVRFTLLKNGSVVSSCDKVVSVIDDTPPSITCPAAVTVQCAAAVPAVNTGSVTATDNCGGTVTITHVGDVISNKSCDNRYTITRTYKGTDVCGNSATCTQIITVNDNTAPTITCPAPVTVQCAADVPAVNTGLTTADNCAGTVTVTHEGDVISNKTCDNRYTITRTYKATDVCGNSATCTQIITVNDNTAPTITCPGPVTVQCAADVPAANTGSVTTSDNCAGTVTVTHEGDVISNQLCANKYTITRTYKATDVCGNSATCTQIITVNDNTAPTITCPAPVTVQCAADVPAANIGSVTTSDNCAGTVTVTHEGDVISNQLCANKYTITRTYKATDVCGNSATCTQIITVNDNTPPTITCPAPVTVQCVADVPAVNTGLTTADNCAGTVTVTHVGDVISNQLCANKYTITRTYKATDVCGNSATCTQIITVNDNTPPTITCPAPVTVQCAADVPAVNTGLTTADNCAGTVTVTHVGDVISNKTCDNRYTITRTYKATDVCGNSTTCTQTITVNDNTKPVISCPGDKVIECGSSTAPTALGTGIATATDNCGTPTVTSSDVSSTTGCQTLITRTWTATDACGNTATCVQRILIRDRTDPVITCPTDGSPATATDNCTAPANIRIYYVDAGTTRTWTAIDESGNTASCTQTIAGTANFSTIADEQSKKAVSTAQTTVKAYPNPFSDKVKFVVTAAEAGNGNLEVFNLMGQKIKTVYQGFIVAGTQTFELSLPTKQISNLVYILRMGDKKISGKVLQVNQ